MSKKYHITPDGRVMECFAGIRPCPYGNANAHYSSQAEAREVRDKIMQDEYGVLPISRKRKLDDVLNDPDSITNKVMNVFPSERRGFQYECFAAETLAESMDLNNVIALHEKDGLLSIEGSDDFGLNAQALSRAIQGLETHYEKQGVEIVDAKGLAKVVYFNDDMSKMLVQSGGPNVLDAAVFEADEVVDVIEVKRLGNGGAQLSSQVLETDEAGYIMPSQIEKFPEYLHEALRKNTVQSAMGTNTKLRLTNEEALTFFVDQYKEKGASSFVYTTSEGLLLTEDLSDDTEEIVKRLNSKGVRATVNLRANYGKQKVTQKELDRFDFYSSHRIFKDGLPRFEDTFKLKDVDPDRIGDSAGYVRIDEFILPVKTKDLKNLPDDFEVNKYDMEYFPLTLTGTIKVY